MIQNSVEASRNASRLRPCWSRSVNTGTNAADSAACANRFDIRFGIWEAIVNAEAPALVPKKLAATISRPSPATRESAGGEREDRGVDARAGGAAAAAERLAARPRRWSSVDTRRAIVRAAPRRLRGFLSAHGQHPLTEEADPARRARAAREPPLHLGDQDLLPPPRDAPSPAATTARPRPSTATLVQTIDKAVKRGALHRNTGARKKSRAARVRRGRLRAALARPAHLRARPRGEAARALG